MSFLIMSIRSRRAAQCVVLLVVVASLGGCLQMLDPISADEYTVTYDPNGADGGAVPETRTSTAGDILVLAANHRGLTRTGFEFVGWNTVADGSGTSFPAGGSLAVDGDTTLFAIGLSFRPTSFPTMPTEQMLDLSRILNGRPAVSLSHWLQTPELSRREATSLPGGIPPPTGAVPITRRVRS
jgi:hypothetical protein